MDPSQDCFVCQKHKQIEKFSGTPIAERDGWVLAHFAFIEGEKATKGHLILETKRHITDITELSDEEASAFGELLRFGVQRLKSGLGAEHVYVFRINDKTPHLHFHLVPRYPGTPREFWGLKITEWPGRETLNLEQIQELSQRL